MSEDTACNPMDPLRRELEALRATLDAREQELAARNLELAAARERAEHYRALNRLGCDWRWSLDADLRLVEVSAEAEAITGLPPQRWLGTRADDGSMPQAAPVDADAWQRVLQSRSAFRDVIFRVDSDDGCIVYIAGSGEPIEVNGRFLGYRGTARDVSKAERAKRLVAAQSETLEQLVAGHGLASALEVLCRRVEGLLSRAGLCSVMLLDACDGTLGAAAAPNLPEAYRRKLHGIPIGPTVGTCGAAAAKAEPVYTRDIASDPNWSAHPQPQALALACGLRACWSTPIFGRDHEVLGTFAIYHQAPAEPESDDVASLSLASSVAAVVIQHRRKDEAMQALNASLEERVRERTAALEASLASLESFSYAISHDMRTPLRAVDGFATLLANEHAAALPAAAQGQIARIRAAVARMDAQIDGLLEYVRVGRTAPGDDAVDMAGIVARIVAEMRLGSVHAPRIDVGPLPSCPGDSARLARVWANLVDNAVKFGANVKDCQISIGAEVVADEIHYHVADNGVGFDMAYADKLFGVFQRLHGHDQFKGAGIGLAIARRIVERHGGRIWCRSKPGEGTTFLFALPARAADGSSRGAAEGASAPRL
jgi:PAS domain S-box-containing protein